MLLRQGLGPREIANRMGISVSSVLQYLRTRVGEGALRLSDIYFAMPEASRTLFQQAISERNGKRTVNWARLPKGAYCREELDLYMELAPSHFRGDLYEYVSAIEVGLHDLVRAALVSHLTGQGLDWWRDGVPLSIRKDCVSRREEDENPVDDDFAYTTFINLKTIMESNWAIFKDVVPKRWADNKKGLMRALDRLNTIRNAVMHPVKKRQWTESDFEFVRGFLGDLRDSMSGAAKR